MHAGVACSCGTDPPACGTPPQGGTGMSFHSLRCLICLADISIIPSEERCDLPLQGGFRGDRRLTPLATARLSGFLLALPLGWQSPMARRNCWWLPRSAILPWSSTTIWPTLPGPSRWWVMNRTDRPSVACSRSAVSAWRASGSRWAAVGSSQISSAGPAGKARANAGCAPSACAAAASGQQLMVRPCRRCAGSSACGVVPGVPLRQQPVRLLRPPGPAGIRVDGRDVAEDRVDDPPGSLDGVLPGEKHAVAVQGGADQPVVWALVAAGPLGERQVLGLRLPPGAGLFARQPQGDRGLRPDPEPQLVAGRQRGQAEDVTRRVVEPDTDLGGGDRHRLAGPDHDRHPGPPPGIGLQPDGGEGLHRRVLRDALDIQVTLILAAH